MMAETIAYDELGDDQARVRIAAGAETPAEMLYFLARDPCVMVRAAVALNTITPAPADAMLASDPDDRVRAVLGRKIASLAAGLSGEGQSRLERTVRGLLITLVADEAERVRAMIADVLKDIPTAPADIVRHLAHDSEISVSEPIIRFSPLLTEEDLIALLRTAPCPGTAGAVARRPGISAAVSDQLVATANSEAICDLLNNPSAAIREATLDTLVANAPQHPAWHEPLVRHPSVSPASMRTLARIVARCLLEVMAGRADLDPTLRAEIQERLEQKISQSDDPAEKDRMTSEAALAQARKMDSEGKLTEASLAQTIRAGETMLVMAMLAVAANLPVRVVERAVSLRSAKGLVSLAWRAGFTMRSATAAQVMLARLPPRAIVNPAPAGGFPLSADEMRWQLEFLENAGK